MSREAGTDLFIRRAQQLNSEFAVTTLTETSVDIIWEMVGGLPLGLELAAAWTRLLSAQKIASELQQGYELLAATHHDLPDRHRNIRTVFDASWRRLTDGEQRVLAQLSLFRGDFALDAALAVTETALLTLLNLGDHSLVQRQGSLFTLHELIRQLAAEKLAAQPELYQRLPSPVIFIPI